ncbi:MAG: chaperone protein HtpG [Oligoflexia bacterium]|nr:MAG: chaperone protein HtpG [Oligoflexia bacterium]
MAKTTQSFNAEIKQLLDIVIHSLYSHKEIFLRELISNSSDALDKLKFQTLTQSDLVPADHKYEIRLETDPDRQLLKVIDSGIGMNPEEVTQFIGTIAKSGTKAFGQLNQELKNRPELIGQFGVGFYSSFMVADKVSLHTQKAGTNIGTLWESTGDGTYTIDEVPRAEGVGTTITLHLKKFDDAEEVQDFTNTWVIKSLVKKYSDFINWPIQLRKEKPPKEGETPDPTKKEYEFETANSQKALWLRSPSDIKPEEYKEFYQHISHDYNEPSKWIHYKAEGSQEFTGLLYVPTRRPWNYNTKDHEYGLSLYIKRVFIMENCKDLLPAYLRFMKGLVDSSDLSLNVSREMLQQDRQVTTIRKHVVNKILAHFKDQLTKEREEYEKFWTEFGVTLKEGIPMDHANQEKIQDLLLFRSTASDKLTTLDEYVSRMKEGQKDIYFITGDRLETLQNSPYLERLKEKNFEVLLLTDAVDEWVTRDLPEFKSKKLISITKEGLDLDTEEEKQKKTEEKKSLQERFAPLTEKMKTFLSKEVKDVVISDRLTETPACLVSGAHDLSAHMEKLMSQMGQAQGMSKRILEINPKHAVIETMLTLPDDKQQTWTEILYNQALLTEGSPLPDPVKFSKMVSQLMTQQ